MIKWKARRNNCLFENQPMYVIDFDFNEDDEFLDSIYTERKLMVESEKESLLDIMKLKKFFESYSPINEYWDYD